MLFALNLNLILANVACHGLLFATPCNRAVPFCTFGLIVLLSQSTPHRHSHVITAVLLSLVVTHEQQIHSHKWLLVALNGLWPIWHYL